MKPLKKVLLITWGLVSFSAMAQNPETESSEAVSSTFLEEIIVVAQRRSENIQDVPIAINAFSGNDLKDTGITDLKNVADLVASAQIFDTRGAGQPAWVIRGVGLVDFNSNNTPVTAVYYDDYYLTSNVMSAIGLFDVGSVEVLKGPQSGLYGRNTTGGAVRLASNKPLFDEQSGYLQASYGSFDANSVEGAGGFALSEKVAVRVAAKTIQGGGFQDSLATPSDDNHGDRDFWGVRGQILFAPSESTEFNLKVEAGEDNSETLLARNTGSVNIATGGLCAPVLAGMLDDTQCLSFANANNVLALGQPLGAVPSNQSDDGRTVLANPINELDNDWFGVNLRGDIDLGFATLTSVTGYLDYTNNQIFDFDTTQLILFEEDGRANLETWSQEFYLTSNNDGPFSWLIGATYAEDTVDEERFGSINDNPLVGLPANFRRSFIQETESWAVYGQGEYELSPRLSLNGSIRYTNEDKELIGYTLDFPSIGFALLPPTDQSYSLDSNVTGHIGVNFKPSDSTLLYAKATRAYKTGGFFGGFAVSPDELTPYREETVWSYEAGWKTDIPSANIRFNGALFYYDYEDVQGNTQAVGEITNTVLTRLGNLGDAEHMGIEFDVLWEPAGIDGLTLQASIAYLDAEISDSITTITSQEGNVLPLEGRDRINSPDFAYTIALGYERNFLNGLTGSLALSFNSRQDLSGTLSPGADSALFRQPGYDLLNANVTLAQTDGGWSVVLIGKNLTDETYITRSAGDNLGSFRSLFGRPREFSIQVGYDW